MSIPVSVAFKPGDLDRWCTAVVEKELVGDATEQREEKDANNSNKVLKCTKYCLN